MLQRLQYQRNIAQSADPCLLHTALPHGATDEEDLGENPLVTFSPSLFFLALLPPIIFNEGYHLKQQFFFGYIKEVSAAAILQPDSICTCASSCADRHAQHGAAVALWHTQNLCFQ
jgi:hypothetical protein